MAGSKAPLVKSASRTLDIIGYIAKSAKPPNFTAILHHLDIPKSSLSLLLHELVNSDYLDYDPETRVYYPGLKLIQISAVCINNTNISREISQGIKKLSDEFGETTHAGILDGRHIVYIAKHHGSRDVSVVATIGYRIPAHATAIGKVLLSTLPDEELEARIGGIQLERYTDNTLTDFGALVAELGKVAEQGYAVDNQEIIPGGICVAAPIVDKSHKTVAALSVTMAAGRAYEGDMMPAVVAKVRAMAGHVSMRLGKV
ncbi:IclR family transcriptional regulator [Anaeroselena agilis]|uniref:IclR family transcriptional regulator n=1 Tax=Anaeroselena agilis TaxID=3063788 RepID=A0ABU3P370_9FIRM|nr:IclR family transcriptional regulator [Selenomonadales bacterium 4137-cl]